MVKKKKKKDIKRLLRRMVVSKTIVKKPKVTVKIPEHKAPSILEEPNRFFKNELEQVKKEMFFT